MELIELHSNRLAIFGDIHGCPVVSRKLKELANRLIKNNYIIVFLGDYIDRGPHSVEIVQQVLNFLERYEDKVFALRGNHEDFSGNTPMELLTSVYWYPFTTYHEAEEKMGWSVFCQEYLLPLHRKLKIACLIHSENVDILLVHGGISSKIKSLDDLKNPSIEVRRDVLWSDPIDEKGEYPNPRGCGVLFGYDVTEKVFNSLGVNFLIRSHEPRKALCEPYYEHHGRVITISSTSVYGGKPFVLLIDLTKSNKSKLFTEVLYIE